MRNLLKISFDAIFGESRYWKAINRTVKNIRYFFTSGKCVVDHWKIKVPLEVYERNEYVFVKLLLNTRTA